MGKKILLLLGVIAILFIVGCTQTQPTQKEYVCSNGQVVLDSANCPKEEVKENNFRAFDIKVYAGNHPQSVTSFNNMPSTSKVSVDLGSYNQQHYGILYLFLGTNYNEEKVRCYISEYYGSVLNGKGTVDLSQSLFFSESEYRQNDAQRGIQMYYFEKSKKPNEVRFDINCKGLESGYEDLASFYVDASYHN